MGCADEEQSGMVERAEFQFVDPREPSRILRGRVTRPEGVEGPLPWVLVLHGFKGFMDWGFFPSLCERLARGGVAAVAFNASGSGVGSDLETFSDLEGFRRDTLSRQLEDVERVRAMALGGALGNLCVDRRGLFGHSRGAAMALVHAAEDGGYRAVATWAALDDFDRWDAATKELWRRTGVLPVVNARTGQELPMGVECLLDFERQRERFDVQAAAQRLRAPLFMLHGEADEVVSVESSRRLFDLAPGRDELGTLAGQGHALGATHPLEHTPEALESALQRTARWLCAGLEGAR